MYKIAQGGRLFPLSEIFLLAQGAAHSRLFVLSVAASRLRARASRDITVPIGTSVAWAISR